jgi:hypothetical protein
MARVGVKPFHPQRPFPIEDPSPDNQPLFTKCAALVQESRNLLTDYSSLATLKVDTSARNKLISTLAKEEDDIEAAINAGRRVARADVLALLGVADNEPIEHIQRGSTVLKIGAQDLQDKARARGEVVDEAKMEDWGAVAAQSVKAVGKFSKVAGEE